MGIDCPRCNGVVVAVSIDGDPSCVTCGWQRTLIPQDVQDEVDVHLGEPYMTYHEHKQIGKGKAPISGWDGEKRRRERLQNA